MALSDNLILLLDQLAKSQSEIRMLNIYKGLPITCDTSIHSVGEFEIRVPSSKQQIACLYHQRETFLHGENLPFLIRSQVISLNLDKEEAVLSNFEVAKSDIGKRAQIRVEPEESLISFIQFVGLTYDIPAPLADISAEGASIYLDTLQYSSRLFQPGNEISITISFSDTLSQKIKKLNTKALTESRISKPMPRPNASMRPDGNVIITSRGKITSVHQEPRLDRYRIGMRLYFQDLARMVILQYLSQRQSEIIRDLRILSEELYSRKR